MASGWCSKTPLVNKNINKGSFVPCAGPVPMISISWMNFCTKVSDFTNYLKNRFKKINVLLWRHSNETIKEGHGKFWMQSNVTACRSWPLVYKDSKQANILAVVKDQIRVRHLTTETSSFVLICSGGQLEIKCGAWSKILIRVLSAGWESGVWFRLQADNEDSRLNLGDKFLPDCKSCDLSLAYYYTAVWSAGLYLAHSDKPDLCLTTATHKNGNASFELPSK